MFKLPNLPSPKADTHELADFVELLSWIRSRTSAREVIACLGRMDDNDNNFGCNDDDDENADVLDEVFNEIERRAAACGTGYPFELERKGTVLRVKESVEDTVQSIIYLYLLLCTRLNMKDNRVQAGIDGADLLEKLSAHVLGNYLGAKRARSLVFGTSQRGSFSRKVDKLCGDLGEGVGFRSLGKAATHAKDDKLDVVAWIPFSDSLPGQLIVFCQCKTGTNWRDSTAQLQPDGFMKKWMREPILVTPMRVFCVAEAVDRARWKSTTIETGVLFDRCRLVDFCEGIPMVLENNIRSWTLAAKRTVGL